jgi:hypothetical protein
MMLVGCAINGMNPFGGDESGNYSGMATMTVSLIGPEARASFLSIDELPIVNARLTIVDVLGGVQATNWIPGSASSFRFLPIKPGLTTLSLFDVDNTFTTNSAPTTNFLIRAGYNYRLVVALGGSFYMIESNVSVATVSNELAIYSEAHVTPVGNNVFANGANLFIWTPALVLNEIATAPYEGVNNWNVTRAISTTNFIGFGITFTNGVKNYSLYNGGHMKFAYKNANAGNIFKVGMISVTGVVTNDASVDLSTLPGYAADGNWHFLSIPLASFTGVNLATLSSVFYLASTAIVTNAVTSVFLDEIRITRD